MARSVQYFTNEQRDTVIAIVDDSVIKKVRFTVQNGYHSIKTDKSPASVSDINKVRETTGMSLHRSTLKKCWTRS